MMAVAWESDLFPSLRTERTEKTEEVKRKMPDIVLMCDEDVLQDGQGVGTALITVTCTKEKQRTRKWRRKLLIFS